MKNRQFSGILSFAAIASVGSAQLISPTTGIDYSDYGVSAQGGVVIDIVGTSGVQVISQIAAVDLFNGYYNALTNAFFGLPGPASYIPDSILGIGSGYSAGIVGLLGGGIAKMAVRLTEYDGDTGGPIFGPGMNQYNPDINGGAYVGINLLVNGVDVADFEDVGFESGVVDTGFFVVSDGAMLAGIFSAMEAGGEVILGYDEGLDKGIAMVDFLTGLTDAEAFSSLRPTVVKPDLPIPEPSILGLLGFFSIAGLVALRRRR